jgi:predicted nucleotidyltransferase component of viral defense system
MKYADASGFRMALEQRLKVRAARDGARLARDRKRVVFDRLLARLLTVAEGRWLLKGGFALDLRLAARARSTKDIDIEWRAGEGELLDRLLDAADCDVGDFFVFSIERAGAPRWQSSLQGLRDPGEPTLRDVPA